MKVAYMFSGQGAQCAGMGRELYDQFPACRAIFDEASQRLGFSMPQLCFTENDRLNLTEFTQPAILTMSMACLQLLKDCAPPAYLLGLSLGEYTALTASGAFAFGDAVALVRKRGRFMTEAVPAGEGAMTALMGVTRAEADEICAAAAGAGIVVPANYNMPGQVVIAGQLAAVQKAEEAARERGVKKTIRLQVSGPFHTKLLQPAAELLREELLRTTIGEMMIPVVSNLTAREIPNGRDAVVDTLTRQVMSPTLWEDSIRYLIEQGFDTFVELGPGKTLCSFVKKIDKEVLTLNIEDVKSCEAAREALG